MIDFLVKTEANMSADQCAAICNNVASLKFLTRDFAENAMYTTKLTDEKVSKVH